MAGEPRRYEIVSAVEHTSQGRTYLAREVAGGGLVRLWVPEVDLHEA